MNEKQLAALKRQEPDVLAIWWCQLNRWEWPSELPDEESRDEYAKHMLGNGGAGVFKTVRSEIMRWIEKAVSPKDISREWNRDMPDDYFEDFWRGNHEGDEGALERYRVRLREESVHHHRTRKLTRGQESGA